MADDDRELIIPLKLDRTQAKQALAAHEGEARQSIDRTTQHETQAFEQRLANAKKVDEKRKADAKKTAEEIKGIEDQYILKDYESRVQKEERLAAKKKADATRHAETVRGIEDQFILKDYHARVGAEQKKQQLSKETTEKYLEQQVRMARANESLASGFGGAAIAGVAIGAVTGVMGAVTSVIEQGRAKAAELAKEFLASRDALRALASATGQPASGVLAVNTALYGAQTGLGAEKSRQFLEPFESAAGGVKGQNLSEAEYGKYRQYAGTLTQAKGLDATTSGEIMGGVLKSENFQAKGQGGLEAAARAQHAIGILETGKGRIGAPGRRARQQ